MKLRDRIEKIKTVKDAEVQIKLAKKYAIRLRNLAKKQLSLAEKLSMQRKVESAEKVLRDLRRLIWDIEDVLKEGLPATSVLSRDIYS
jgi:hydroxylamine reductase (hybrid-cluster protein)